MATWDDDNLCWREYDELVHETDDALLLSIEGEEIWLPKLELSDEPLKIDKDDQVVGIPRWLAKKKGLTED